MQNLLKYANASHIDTAKTAFASDKDNIAISMQWMLRYFKGIICFRNKLAPKINLAYQRY
jgi:hypothetical protein